MILKKLVLLLLVSLSSEKKKQKKKIARHDDDGDDEDKMNVSPESNIADSGINLDGTVRRQYALEAAIKFKTKNMICSPLSALLPLGKLALGAKGEGLKELLGAIGIRKRSQVKLKFKSLINSLKSISGVKLDIVSRVYVAKNSALYASFEQSAIDVFHSSVEKIDFTDKVGTVKAINDWVNKETHEKIPSIITENDIDESASVILINAIYFSGEWMNPFTNTISAEFHTEDGPIQVPTMVKESTMMYYRSRVLDAEIIEIPYKEGFVSFFAVVPKAKNGLNVLINQLKLTPELLDEEVRKLQPRYVKLHMPRFKIETSMDMGDLYKQVGAKKIFSADSGLTEIVMNTNVAVSKAIQKAMIEVTETGTEAAAVSAIIGMGSSMYQPQFQLVRLNRPFYFLITAQREQIFTGVFAGKSE